MVDVVLFGEAPSSAINWGGMSNPNQRKSESLSFRSALRQAGEAAHAGSNEVFKRTLEFDAAELDVQVVTDALVRWYESEGLETQTLEFANGVMVQSRRTGVWRRYVGMNSEITVLVKSEHPRVVIEVGAGKWAAKAGAGAAGLVGAMINPHFGIPYLGGVAYGTWEQNRLRQRTLEIVEEVASRRRPDAGEIP